MEKKNRDYSMDLLRIAACFLVVYGHTAVESWYSFPPDSYSWTVLNFIDTFARPSIPIFIMISGYLFLSKERINYKSLWKNNILHLLVVYAVWILFYAIVYPGARKSLSDLSAIRDNLFGLHPAFHLWYMRMTINVYVVIPLLWALVRVMDKKLLRYFLFIFVVFGVIRTTIYDVSYYKSWIHQQIDLFDGMEFVKYTAYFMLGYFLADPSFSARVSDRALLVIYLLALIAGAAVNQFISIHAGEAVEALYNTFSLPVFIEAVCLFLLFRRKLAGYTPSEKTGAWIRRISGSTLFVYLVHPYLINRVQIHFHITTASHNVAYWVLLLAVLIFAFASVIGMLLKKIPIINRIVL